MSIQIGAKPSKMAAGGPDQPALQRRSSVELIRFIEVSKIYGTGEAEVVALDRVNFSVRAGEFVAVLGPSGSGKSTAMNILGCLDTPSSGHYLFRGVDVGTLTRDQRALIRRNHIGFVFQGFNLLKRTSAIENLELPLIYRGMPKAERRAAATRALALVGLSDRASHTASELSGGQQQRVAIARALVTAPSVIFADEPTGNLDSARGHEIMNLLRALNAEHGMTIVVVTHDEEIAAYAGRRIHFLDGRIASDEAFA
ncbi:MAG TPA: ABC transporter ATP-binding protein [Micropepsaceae bacterium]|nr:ABC transporter ATP-binding protein [Micropepsaceae bacterium]